MSKCFSFTASRDWFYRYSFANAGLRTSITDMGEGTVVHCWAECLMRMLRAHGVERASLVGISYGGFVGYSMAAQFPGAIDRLVLCCAGVCLEEKDMEDGLFKVQNLDEAASILMPQTPEKLKELMRFSFVKPAKGVPTYFLSDFIDVCIPLPFLSLFDNSRVIGTKNGLFVNMVSKPSIERS
ncbi:unnamed protein product [Linum tenue]|uniref:AB hydrolase-1 domain-containing protein n=1 Tax=Linum tenue TaxID=586396 RepID=A0AAV0MR14_9ROSI|nr:unnamed protein product [Linum tenue]